MSVALLELRDVHAAYLRREVLRGVSLRLYTGELVALAGENGSGKSTTLRVIAGLLRASRGVVEFRGRDLAHYNVFQRQRLGIGFLMQGARVFPNLTVGENFNLAVARCRCSGTEPARLGEWFPLLRNRQADRAGLLSGGQRQMLALELVLAQRPELLLLDEPTGALTAEATTEMMSALMRYISQDGAAALLVEHSILVLDFAIRQLRLRDGALIADNPR